MIRARKIPLAKRVSYLFETAAAYLIYGFFSLFTLDAASDLGGWIMRRLGPRLGVTRTAYRNLALALPEKTDAEKREIVEGMWENLGRVIAEYPHLKKIADRIDLAGMENARDVLESGKPAIFFGGHLANWEIPPVCARRIGMPLHVVYRRPNNPWVDGLLRHARAAGAVGQIPKGTEGALEILAVLRKKESLGILVDQKMNEGMAIPFFGHDAMTGPGVAQFAVRVGCGLCPLRIERLQGARFRLTIEKSIPVEDTGDREADYRRIMTEVNRHLEIWIRARPEQWLWIHNRWPEQRKVSR
ncbi:MAG TPA: lauroyl acyltransferase [Patescibacteria group bacterium]|nr:lauroyl acyltransferase [Patescibacteria group bacterium]